MDLGDRGTMGSPHSCLFSTSIIPLSVAHTVRGSSLAGQRNRNQAELDGKQEKTSEADSPGDKAEKKPVGTGITSHPTNCFQNKTLTLRINFKN